MLSQNRNPFAHPRPRQRPVSGSDIMECHFPQIEWRSIAQINRRLVIDAATDPPYTDDSSNVPGPDGKQVRRI